MSVGYWPRHSVPPVMEAYDHQIARRGKGEREGGSIIHCINVRTYNYYLNFNSFHIPQNRNDPICGQIVHKKTCITILPVVRKNY